MNKYLFSLLLVILSSTFQIIAEEDNKVKDKEVIKSLDEERKDTLKYGIDIEVKELIGKLTKEKIKGYDSELTNLLETTYDEDVKSLIFEYFILMDISSGEKEALKIYDAIEYEDEYKDSYATITLKYLSKIGSKEALKRIPDILLTENESVISAILKMIGENKVKEEESRLLEMLEDEETNDQTYLRVIKTLGEIESKKALELLIPIVDDKDEETSIRMAVCFSLGEIGDDSAIPVLKRALGERTNFLLRKSALEALAKFDKFNLNDTLIESLKDPQWQIRMSACRSLGERKVEKAFPILKYKALKDPEAKIKKEALKAIGEINSDECREFLKDVYTKDTYTDNARLVAIEKLIEHNVDWIFPSIEELYKSDHEEKRKPLLDYTLKLLSTKEYNYGTDLYKKMLDSENYLYRIYAIKGIRLNNYTEFTDKVTELSENDKNKSVKKHALSTLEDLK